MRTICASSVSCPTRSARMIRLPVPFTVAPTSGAPPPFSTGIGSPLIIDSSTALLPLTTTPSTGIRSPGRTRSRSPTSTSASGTSSSPLPAMRCATGGARPSSARSAAPVRCRARSSSTCPSSTSTMMTTAVSKYGSTPASIRKPAGNSPGATVAATL